MPFECVSTPAGCFSHAKLEVKYPNSHTKQDRAIYVTAYLFPLYGRRHVSVGIRFWGVAREYEMQISYDRPCFIFHSNGRDLNVFRVLRKNGFRAKGRVRNFFVFYFYFRLILNFLS